MRTRDIQNILSRYSNVQLEQKELMLIAKTIIKIPLCRLLIFGMGHDSPLWSDINQNGRTVFLEDDVEWYNSIHTHYPHIEAYMVTYPTRITQWDAIIDEPDLLGMEIPEEISGLLWDVIIVDGPVGNGNFLRDGTPEPPGRMSSIFMASQLVGENGFVFVHDCNRPIERIYSDRFLCDMNLLVQTSTAKKLRQYQIKSKHRF
jgi:hypothetical protein